MSSEITTSSLRMFKPLRGYRLSLQDSRDLNELLKELSSEAGELEIVDYVKGVDETQEKFESDKQFARSLFNIYVRIEAASGAIFSQSEGSIFHRPDMPRQVTGMEFDTNYAFRERANRDSRI